MKKLIPLTPLLLLTLAAGDPTDPRPVVTPAPAAQTTPVPHAGDAADDPAVWHHPTDPARSLILGTDKQGGLIAYDVDGRQRQIASPDARPNNVDVLYDVPLAGQRVDLAVAGCRAPKSRGLKFWRINPDTRALIDVTANNAVPVFRGGEPYGSCVYRSPTTGASHVFVNDARGRVEQYELKDDNGRVTATKVRAWDMHAITEGCVADDHRGVVYIAQETVGIWRFGAEPADPTQGKLIARVGQHGLFADVEGLALYRAAGGKGYLIASSQGNDSFKVYDRTGDNAFVCTIDPKAGNGIDDASDTDGITVTNRPLGPRFPHGALIVQDGSNQAGHQNFKLYKWEDIARDKLLIDSTTDPRKPD